MLRLGLLNLQWRISPKLLIQQNHILTSQPLSASLWNCKNVQASNANDTHSRRGNDNEILIYIDFASIISARQLNEHSRKRLRMFIAHPIKLIKRWIFQEEATSLKMISSLQSSFHAFYKRRFSRLMISRTTWSRTTCFQPPLLCQVAALVSINLRKSSFLKCF